MKKILLVTMLLLSVAILSYAQSAPSSGPAGRPASRPAQSSTQPIAKPEMNGWMDRHEKFKAIAAAGNVDLLFLGDSITEGWSKRIWTKYYGGLRAANFGIASDRTQNLMWRIQNGELTGISPKVVILEIGSNNTQQHTAAQTADGIKACIDAIRSRLPDAKILVMAIFPREQVNARRQRIYDCNELIKKFDDGKNIRVLNINDKLMQADGTITKDLFPDMVHPNARGYEIWAGEMHPLLEEMMGRKIQLQAATSQTTQP